MLKELLEVLLMPLTFALLLGAAALGCRVLHRKRAAAWLFGVAAATVYLASTSMVGDALLSPLEHRYPPLQPARIAEPVPYVVVLGSGYIPRDGVSVTAALADVGLVRIVDGVSIFRQLHSAHLVVSGGARPGVTPSAWGYAILARDLGVASDSLIVLDKPRDTDEEAHALANLIGPVPFVLVTSAYHMPRAMRLMLRLNLHPIPAPTGQSAGESPVDDWRRYVPNGAGLRKTERALHEYLGSIALAAGIA